MPRRAPWHRMPAAIRLAKRPPRPPPAIRSAEAPLPRRLPSLLPKVPSPRRPRVIPLAKPRLPLPAPTLRQTLPTAVPPQIRSVVELTRLPRLRRPAAIPLVVPTLASPRCPRAARLPPRLPLLPVRGAKKRKAPWARSLRPCSEVQPETKMPETPVRLPRQPQLPEPTRLAAVLIPAPADADAGDAGAAPAPGGRPVWRRR